MRGAAPASSSAADLPPPPTRLTRPFPRPPPCASPPTPPTTSQDGCDFSWKHTKAAYVAFQNRNKDPALSAPIAKAEGGDDDMSRALGS